MRQIWITKPGPPEVLQLREAPVPTPGPGEVRIAVGAVGVNFADIMGRLGIYRDAPKTPFIPGYEVAGTVDAVGTGVNGLREGDPVMAGTYFGGYSESLCVPAAFVYPRPQSLTVAQAAGFPVPFLTAYEALVALARIRSGDHVLIHAAAGGLGLACVAIAQRFGATIYGTASAGKHAFLLARGVQHPIDYRHKDFEREIARLSPGHGMDVVVDSIGGNSWAKSYRALAPAGKLIMCGMSSAAPGTRRSLPALIRFALTTPWLMFNPVRLTSDNKAVMGVNVAKLWTQPDLLRCWADEVLAWVAEGEIDVHVDRTFPFEAAAEAHRYIQSRQNTGKVVLEIS